MGAKGAGANRSSPAPSPPSPPALTLHTRPSPFHSQEGYCDHSPIGGATEEDLYCTTDAGLAQADTTLMATEWKTTMAAAAAAIQAHGGWAWYMFTNSGAPSAAGCAAYFRGEGATLRNTALLYTWTNASLYPLPNVAVDFASFLLVRGDFAWIGYAWLGCTDNSVPGHGTARYTAPSEMPALAHDYGVPVAPYAETAPGSAIFSREWTKATVEMDCNTYTPTIVLK